ncbi:MAG: CRISPR system precrRNA processing endoribonuclease RAMP protein Cas6 [Spirochaetales bacterium]|nr:CRISPR system precrRNA processing endoribonuclease RAMP protein Cas6 [Spirochaetales bacterium]
MKDLHYRHYSFELILQGAYQGNEFALAFRSLLGLVLHEQLCQFATMNCPQCPLRETCDYTALFETSARAGYDITLYSLNWQTPTVTKYSAVKFDLFVFHSLERFDQTFWLPIFRRMGALGVGKMRIAFQVNLLEVKDIHKPLPAQGDAQIQLQLTLQTRTPWRLLHEGGVVLNPEYATVLRSCYQRLENLYPEARTSFPFLNFDTAQKTKTIQTHFERKTWYYFSTRQKKKIALAGVEGSMSVEGSFSGQELFYLYFGEIAGVGKSLRFGLGRYQIH